MLFNTGCSEGNLRLVDGLSNKEGRVEVCKNGSWGTVCAKSEWTAQERGFVCSRLEFSRYSKIIIATFMQFTHKAL